jgi:cytochrome P450
MMGPVLLRHADVATVLHNPSFEQLGLTLMEYNGVTSGPLHEWWAQIMFANEGDRHARLRAAVRGWLTPRRVGEVADPVRAATTEIVAALPAGEWFDLAAAIADPIPVIGICELLGVDADRVTELGNATTEVGMAFGIFDADERRRIEVALETLLAWADDALASARPDTLAHSIAQDARCGRIDRAEAVTLVTNLLFAAHDTTRFLLANACYELGRNPTVWDDLVTGRTDAADVAEETARFQPPATGTSRIATRRTRIGGLDVEPGQIVGVSLWSAARDPRVHHDPDRFVPGRREAPLLSFGHGAHYCIGAALARVEATTVLRTLATTCPGLEIDSANARQRPGGAAITGIDHLPARP